MELKTIALVLILNFFSYGFCQNNEETEGVEPVGYFNTDSGAEQPQDLMAIESKQNNIYSKGPINNQLGYLEKKVTTINHRPKLPFKIGKPIYAEPIQFKSQGNFKAPSNINWIKSLNKPNNFGHGKQPVFNFKPQFQNLNLKGHGITKQLNNLIPTNFGGHTHVVSAPPVYDLDFGKFKTSSVLPAPQIAPLQYATQNYGSSKQPAEIFFSPDLFKTQNIASNSGDFKLELPKNYGVQTLHLEQPQQTKSTPIEGGIVKYDTFVPGVSNYDGKTPESFENYEKQGKSGEANSYVKVTNGKTTYYYQIRHLVNKH